MFILDKVNMNPDFIPLYSPDVLFVTKPEFTMYCEESEICQKARSIGISNAWHLVFIPNGQLE